MLVEDVDNQGSYAGIRKEGIWEIPTFHSFCCEPKTTLRNKFD